MNKYDLISIYKFFGRDNQQDKLLEEFTEFKDAFRKFRIGYHVNNQDIDDMEHVLEELGDCLVLALQIYIIEYGGNIEEFEGMIKNKIGRTLSIIEKCETPNDYEKIRNSDLK